MIHDSNERRRRGRGPVRGLLPAALSLVLLLLLSSVVAARPLSAGREDGEKPKKDSKEMIEKKLRELGPGGEAEALIERIREGMKKEDENLLAASARGVSRKMKANARYLEELLHETRSDANRVIRDLDTLIKSVKYRKQQSGNSGQCSQPPQGGGGGTSTENRPRTEKQDQGLQKKPDSGGKKNEKDKEGGGKKDEGSAPRDRQPGKDKGGKPPAKKSEKVRRSDLSGRWGVLPPKIQKEILNFNIENFPEKYRKWLEEYYRRVNRRPDR